MNIRIFQSFKGDCLLIESAQGGKRILCDGGTPAAMRTFIAKELEDIETIDLVYVSHIDQDHIGGVLTLLEAAYEWKTFKVLSDSGDPPRSPQVPVVPAIKGLWHNSFRDLIKDNRGAIGDLAYVIQTKQLPPSDLLVIAGDNFFDFDLASFVDFGKKQRPNGVIAVYDVGDKELAKRYGLVRTDPGGKILEFQEKPPEPKTTLASSGIYWLPKETWSLLDRYISSGHNTDQPGHYMRWLAETAGLFAFSLKGKWLDIGDLASYEKAKAIVNTPTNPKE